MTRLFSLVVSAYNVAPYLDRFLSSLAAQTYPVGDLELVFVDDGSTDASPDIIATWIAAVAPAATLLRKKNGGLSSARNAGLDHVTGTWVTFCDPDDTLSPHYFLAVAKILRAHRPSGIDLVATRLLMRDDRTTELRDEHPLRFRFEGGNRVVDLERDPRYFHLSAASGFYRVDRIVKQQLRFDERIRPNFEDGHFTGRYLASVERPRVAVVRDAEYHYRRRRDASSLVQDSWNRPEKYTAIPRHGHLDLLAEVHASRGQVPVWLQNLVLYDLMWYFKHDERMQSLVGKVDNSTAEQFHEILPQILRFIDTTTIDAYDITAASAQIRHALIIAKGQRLRPDRLHIDNIDVDQLLARVRYFYGGDLPQEEFRVGGKAVEPVYGKSRSLTFVGKPLACERIVWLPSGGSLEVTLDGRGVPVDARGPKPPPDNLSWYRALRLRAFRARRRLRLEVDRARRRRYRDAWVFIDRNRMAQDNAEHLYRHVKQHHPAVNAWFVVDRDTADWPRLEREGFRLVEYGTPEHRSLMLECIELISSHVEPYIVRPFAFIASSADRRQLRPPRWRFTYLQHGVTTGDLSRWVNREQISCFVTATEAEHRSIAGDGTPYVFTDKEVRLTGFPRHDRLLRLARDPAVLASDRLLLVMPTWRRQLVEEPTKPGGERRARPDFWRSTYARGWVELLTSERLRQLAGGAGLRIAFLPHPEMSVFHTNPPLPSHVEVHRYEDVDIQEVLARGAGLITDYSSNAFELAYLGRPVIHFQSDPVEFFSGQHTYRRGEWSYEDDGFGPVAARVPDVLDELERLVLAGMTAQEPYATRMAHAFAFRDGESCERVFEAIRSMRNPVT